MSDPVRKLRRAGARGWALAAVVSLLVGACVGDPASRPDGPSSNAPEQADRRPALKGKQIGREFIGVALSKFEFRTEYEVAGLVRRVGEEVAKGAGVAPGRYHFLVVKNPQANAFAVPGGYIFIFDGLLRRLHSEEELAGVLAHEVGHVRNNHFFKDRKKVAAAELAAIAAILLSSASGNGGAAMAFSLAGASSLQLAYSRNNEREADMSAIGYLDAADYDPSGLLGFFDTLHRQELLVLPQSRYPYLATHPGLAERYERIKLLLARREAPGRRAATRDDAPWQHMSGILAEETMDRRPVAGSSYQQGITWMTANRLADARPLLQQALDEAPDALEKRVSLADCLLGLGDLDAAEQVLAQVADPKDTGYAPLLAALGGLAERRGEGSAATDWYRQTLAIDDNHPLAHFRLSELLRAAGETGKAQLHLAHYLRLKLEVQEAAQVLLALEKDEATQADEALLEQVQATLLSIAREGL